MTPTSREIIALISLLGDSDPDIRAVVWNRLMDYGEPAERYLLEIARLDCEGVVRIQARTLLEEIRLNRLADTFSRLNDREDFDLEKACFILAQLEYPELAIATYSGKLDELARAVAHRIAGCSVGRVRVLRMNQVLFGDRGFRGNTESYDDPENSFINRVLDRQLGIPISLAAVYLFVANRLDLPMVGVSFPGHFLLRYKDASERFYVDPFNKGKILDAKDCANMLTKRGHSYHDYYLTAAKPRDILSRMIRNLVHIYQTNNQPNKIDALERIFSDFVMT